MSPLKFLKNLLLALTGQTEPGELAASVALGLMIALIPKGNLLAQGLILIAFLGGFNTALSGVSAVVFLLFTPLTDPLADKLGYFLLVDAGALKPLWTWLYNRPLLPWTAFNNTLVLGSFTLGLALFLPVYFGARMLLAAYQAKVQSVVMKWKVVQVIKASAFIQWLYS